MDGGEVLALRRGLSVLDAFQGRDDELGVNELARAVGLHRSTVSRLCATLEASGYLRRNPATRRYLIGDRLFELAGAASRNVDLRETARPILEDLVSLCRETATMVMLDGHEIITVDVVDGLDFVRMQARVGGRTPIHASSAAKALLAWQEPEDLAKILTDWPFTRLTKNTITTSDDLARHLVSIKAQGYSVDREELELGLRCVGAPIRDRRDQVMSAISISGPRHRMSEERIRLLGPLVRHAADLISARIGASPANLEPLAVVAERLGDGLKAT